MPLQKQTIPVSFVKGISTKTDNKQIQANVITLENATFISPGKLKKRNGYAALGDRPPAGSLACPMPLITSNGNQTSALMSFQNQALRATTDSLKTYDAALNSWEPLAGAGIGGFYSAEVSKQSILRNSYNVTAPDSAAANGTMLFAWEDTVVGQRVVYSVVDQATGIIVQPPTPVGASKLFQAPKCLAIGNSLILLAVGVDDAGIWRIFGGVVPQSGGVVMRAITPATGLTRLKQTTGKRVYDASVIQTATGARLYIVYNDSSTGSILSTVPLVVSTGGISFWYSVASDPMTQAGAGQLVVGDPASVLTVFGDLKQQAPVCVYLGASASLFFRAFDASMTVLLGSGTLDTSLSNFGRVTGVSTSSAAISWKIFYNIKDTGGNAPFNDYTKSNTVSGASYGVGTSDVFMRSVSVGGKAFTYGGRAFVPLAHLPRLQPTIFIVSAVAINQGYVAAKILSGLIGSTSTTALLPETNAVSATKWQFAALEKDLLTVTSGKLYSQNGVDSISFDFASNNTYLRAALGNNLHISGGFVQLYDGQNITEHGFHLFPENVSLSGGGAGAFTYSYVCTYEWMDNQGNWHRSAPSPAVSISWADAIENHSPVVTIPTLRITAKQGVSEAPNLSPVYCVVYRTAVNGTTYYLEGAITAMPANDITVDSVTFNSGMPDATLIGNALLYGTGAVGGSNGVVENIAPNPCTSMIAADSRVWYIDSLTGAIGFSKQVVPGAPVEFSDFLSFNVNQGIGTPTALALMDGKKIVFRASAMSFLAGIGPSSTGIQNDLIEYPIQSDVGCSNPRSIAPIPSGLMFQSAKGIYLLDRSLQVSYIGADVEAYNSATVTSALAVPGTQQVRFTLNTGVCLVYDYYMGQWGVFTNINAVDATIYGNQYTYASAGGVFQETPGLFVDPSGAFISMRVVTSWLQFAQVQGFQRARRLLVLGDWASAHNLVLKVAYDFATSFSQTDTIPALTSVTPEQYRIHLATQKCEALQISIQDSSSGTNGEGFSLSGLALEVGLKSGPFRLPASKSFG